MTFIGANINGLGDGSGNVAGTNYNVPKPSLITDAGLTLARVAFKSERWYDAAGYQGIMLGTVTKPLIAAKVMTVFDAHEYGSVWSETAGATVSFYTQPGLGLFQKLWSDVHAQVVADGLDQDYVCYGLQNEPGNTMTDVEAMAAIYQPIITSLRSAGYKGWFTVPEHGSSQATNISLTNPYAAVVVDPLNRTVLELHNYGDKTGEGLGDVSAGPTTMHDRFSGAIAWFRTGGKAAGLAGLFMGEFGSPDDAVSAADFSNAVNLFMASTDVVWGFAAWTMDTWLAKNGNFLGSASAPTTNLLDLENAGTPLCVYLAGDSYQGAPVATILVDGVAVLSGISVTATRTGAPQAVRVPGVLTAGAHTVGVEFVEDAWGGGIGKDRNLYVLGVTYEGALCAGCPGDFAALATAGTHTVAIVVPG